MPPVSFNRREAFAALLAAPAAALAASPTEWTLLEASQQIRAKKISPVELTRACLDRIALLNPQLNAFITVMAEQALEQARALEAELHTGKWRGPLHGIPIGLKDLFDTAGVKTTCASAVFADRIPAEDAEVVLRLKRAGALVVGKQNMHEFAYGSTSVPSHFGAVHNPWNAARIAGGSSGGSAASVAAGLCFGALGSDTGGSIRQPAAYCGITGLKPTYGRVSTRGVVPLSWSLDHAGPLGRTAADAALLLDAIAGYDPGEPNSSDYPMERYSTAIRAKTGALKIGVVRHPFFEQLDPEIEAAVNKAIETIGKTRGCRRRSPTASLRHAAHRPRRSVRLSSALLHQESGVIPAPDPPAHCGGRGGNRRGLYRSAPRTGPLAAVRGQRFFELRSAHHAGYSGVADDD
jgi:aspartyl-tRNA(Asn)/glutamyl-tRNA(Gln) amidotransferase subunit A